MSSVFDRLGPPRNRRAELAAAKIRDVDLVAMAERELLKTRHRSRRARDLAVLAEAEAIVFAEEMGISE